MAAADNHGLLAGSSLPAAAAGVGSTGFVQGSGNQAAAVAAAGVPGMVPRDNGGNGGGRVSPFEGNAAINTAVMAGAAAAGGYGAAGASQLTAHAQECTTSCSMLASQQWGSAAYHLLAVCTCNPTMGSAAYLLIAV
jgi:hypothetical protein